METTITGNEARAATGLALSKRTASRTDERARGLLRPRTRKAGPMSETKWLFAHCVSGKWFFSNALIEPPASMQAYRRIVQARYGDLRGVRFADYGKDYDEVTNICGRLVPTKSGYYIRLAKARSTSA